MGQPHPLLQYPVLRKLIPKLDFHEILTFREVCYVWKTEADSRLKNKVVIKITSEEALSKFLSEISPHTMLLASTYHIQHLNLNNTPCIQTFLALFGAQITSLKLELCEWRSATLRHILFKKLPNLTKLEVSTTNKQNWLSAEPLMPMSFIPCGSFCPLSLLELKITGDYSNRTDLFYDLLKSSPNLEMLHLSKSHPENDDLFGTWLSEIVLSCEYPHLKSLEVDCTLIQQQVDSLTRKQYPLRRLSIDLDIDAVGNSSISSIDKILGHFPFLESVEVGIDNATQTLVQSIIQKFKDSNCWIAVHTPTGSKIVFPKHVHVLES